MIVKLVGRLLEAAARIRGEFDEEEMSKVILIELNCSNPDPIARPTMRCVIQMFLGEAQVPIVLKTKPSLCFSTTYLLLRLQDSVSDCNELITISNSSS
ncbi:hypothetical protein MKW98_003177 [Papaver atlanticum]|uniref:Uncharacterized protein n=1 Tax=Papaver atlanticum TaxID=357466 RepID=A0AAD4THU9_9MAGN|nr:hypothetical protein MKW98_003177 [Papaver atlanticum]